jgi:hypothetical protein
LLARSEWRENADCSFVLLVLVYIKACEYGVRHGSERR